MEPEVLKKGDDAGNRMVAKYSFPDGVVVYAIGVPQTWTTSLGPTWSYVIEEEKLTLVDTGCNGSMEYLEEGLERIGHSVSSIGRVVITHGHLDHDGNCFQVVSKSGAELWAHQVYASLIGVSRHAPEGRFTSAYPGLRPLEDAFFLKRIKDHEEQVARLKVTTEVTDGLVSNGYTFLYTPGHSPDEICLLFRRILFTGDHVLPLITPHPSISFDYPRLRDALPQSYRSGNRYFGLNVYLRSLKKIAGMGDDVVIMPAHRAYYRDRFNPIFPTRALEIVEHHRQRCQDLIGLLRRGPLDPVNLTREVFPKVRTRDRNFYAAFTEVLSHLELMEETGDVAFLEGEGKLVRWNGTENYITHIEHLAPDTWD